jgi:ribosomal protein S16
VTVVSGQQKRIQFMIQVCESPVQRQGKIRAVVGVADPRAADPPTDEAVLDSVTDPTSARTSVAMYVTVS